MRRYTWMGALTLFSIASAAVVPAKAQSNDERKWEFEVRAGGVWPTNPADGTTSLPGPGQVFTTATGATPLPSSRRESSWYFGDGAILFNQAVSALAMLPGRIATLDPVLARPLGARKPGPSVGISVSRALTRRLGAELSLDYRRAPSHITESNSNAIEATRASFVPAFEGMIRFNRNRVLNSVTSTAALEDGHGRQLAATGALIVNLRTAGDVIPYAAIGAGLISTGGAMPSTTLRGNYQFVLGGGAPINETDIVRVTAARDDRTWAGIFGGGLKYHVSPRWGIRLDARVGVSKNVGNTLLDAAPSVTLGLQPAGHGALGAEPSIQFSNNSSDPVTSLGVTAIAASTLTGPAITGFRTFSSSGIVSHTNLLIGAFWRF